MRIGHWSRVVPQVLRFLLFNRAFWSSTGKLVDLFRRLHNMGRPDEMVTLSSAYGINFLPPVRAADVLGMD